MNKEVNGFKIGDLVSYSSLKYRALSGIGIVTNFLGEYHINVYWFHNGQKMLQNEILFYNGDELMKVSK
ncbi:MAG: hypothetical protein Q8P81_03635 [Nanoarchaeota archaeon]|nr:hypothetical protein [Nanoarchaeota archaeon]